MRAGYTSTTVIFCLIPALAFLFETASAAEESQIRSSPQVTASNVLVVANSAYAGSQDLAKLYATRRGIPADNILALELPATESVSTRKYWSLYSEKFVQARRKSCALLPSTAYH